MFDFKSLSSNLKLLPIKFELKVGKIIILAVNKLKISLGKREELMDFSRVFANNYALSLFLMLQVSRLEANITWSPTIDYRCGRRPTK